MKNEHDSPSWKLEGFDEAPEYCKKKKKVKICNCGGKHLKLVQEYEKMLIEKSEGELIKL